MISKLYLILYNFGQVAGWSYIMYKGILHYLATDDYVGVYNKVEEEVKIFQTLAFLEVLHAALGLVKSPIMVTFIQVYSRVFLVWGICHLAPAVKTTIGPTMMLIAWDITEIIRYSFYGFNLMGMKPYIILWCRYTFFYALYPIGVSGELISCYYSLPHLESMTDLNLSMPNKYNFAFNYCYYVMFMMFLYLPLFPQLYGYMIGQRRKVLGGNSSEKAKKLQ
eukprot:Nk52_evm38s2657 gene=Nk52_evmTU38s2657